MKMKQNGIFYFLLSVCLIEFIFVNSEVPTDLNAEVSDDEIRVSWSPPFGKTDEDITKYKLGTITPQRKDTRIDVYNKESVVPVNNQYGTYYIAVQAYYRNGRISRWTRFLTVNVFKSTSSTSLSTATTSTAIPSTSSVTVSPSKPVTIASNTQRIPLIVDIEQIRQPSVGDDHTLICNPGGNNVTQYTWQINNRKIYSSFRRYVVNGSTLVIRRMAKADTNTKVQCSILTVRMYSASSPVIFLYPRYGPDMVRIYPQKVNFDVEEQASLGPIICSADCYPECSFKWRFKPENGSLQDFKQGNRLEISSMQRSYSGTYRCVVISDDTTRRKIRKIKVVVYYGPSNIILTPNRTEISAVEGQIVSGIRCRSDCGPDCKYFWNKNDKLTETGGTIFDREINRTDEGNYKCVVVNSIPPSSQVSVPIKLTIYYGPKTIRIWNNARFIDKLILYEGENTNTITCDSVCNPACNFTWAGPFTQQVSTGKSITLNNVSRDYAGNYSCTATNNYGSLKKYFPVIVQGFGIKIQNSSTYVPSTLRVIENKSLTLVCKAKCQSVCKYRWKYTARNGQYRYQLGESFYLPEIKVSDTGNYTCFDYTRQLKQRVEIIVLYRPKIEHLTLIDNYDKTYKRNEVKEGQSLNLRCTVDSVPRSSISWIKGNEDLHLKIDNATSSSTYRIEEVSCDDMGPYVCEAVNGIGEIIRKSINIYVRCSPRQPESMKKQFISSIEKELLSDVNFTVNIIGYPPPTARWYFKHNISSVSQDLIATDRIIFTQTEGLFSVNIRNLTEDSFGLYLLELRNAEGTANFNFSLTPKAINKRTPDTIPGQSSRFGKKNNIGLVIGSTIVGIALLGLIVVALIVVMKRKKELNKKDKTPKEPEGLSRDSSVQLDDSPYSDIPAPINVSTERANKPQRKKMETNVYDNYTYDMSEKGESSTGKQDTEIKLSRRQSYTYAEVQKPKNGSGGFEVIPTLGGADGQMNYTYAQVIRKPEKPETPNEDLKMGNDKSVRISNHKGQKKRKSKKKDGLNYVDLELKPPSTDNGRFVIHGERSNTNYSLVDFTKHADPLPSDDENPEETKPCRTDEPAGE